MARLQDIDRGLLNWDESKHPRDRLGRFTFSIGKPIGEDRIDQLFNLQKQANDMGTDLFVNDGYYTYIPELAVQGISDAKEYGFALPDKVQVIRNNDNGNIGRYFDKSNRVELNPNAPIWDDPQVAEPDFIAKHNAGFWWAADTPLSIVHHELAHGAHAAEVGSKDFKLLRNEDMPLDVKKLMAKEVSLYGTTNPVEAVAEVAAGHMNGIHYSPDVYGIYYNYGGPFLKK